MTNNLFDKKAAEQLIKRAGRLTEYNRPLWGEMNAAEMLLHCNRCNRQILNGDVEYSQPGFKKKLVKYLALYIVPRFPKHMKAAEKNITKNKTQPGSFEMEKQAFIAVIRQFADTAVITAMPHPAFGLLTKKEWGIAAWKHTDHHLRQFGI